MMENNTIIDNFGKIPNWSKIAQFSVGGFLYIGFSKKQTNKFLCISSDYISVVDCDTGKKIECEGEYDETDFVGVSAYFHGEMIDIYGEYGGTPFLQTTKGEKIIIQKQDEMFGNKSVVRTKVIFSLPDNEVEIHNNYGFYTCSFSPCGNYFVFVDDGGVTVLKRG